MQSLLRKVKQYSADTELVTLDDSLKGITSPESGTPESFERKVCVRFTSTEGSSSCSCGALKGEHTEDEVRNSATQFISKPTDACGDIHFRVEGRQTQAKYIRLSDETDPNDAIKLLTKHWKLCKPKILISVTGGAKDFNLSTKQRKVFAEGLRKVVETTKVWVITGGTNTGVMKEVGRALRGLSQVSYGSMLKGEKRSKVSLIGIAAWGAIKDRKVLSKFGGTFKFLSAMYRPSRLTYPDNNHSYFLFVDDGRVNHYGGEIEFRAKLEKEITHMTLHRDESDTVPAVQLVVEGGPNTIKTVYQSICHGIPVVIFQNSGRAADLIADVFNGKFDDGESPTIEGVSQLYIEIAKLVPDNTADREKKIEEIEWQLYHILSYRDFVTIFNIEDSISLDAAILKAWIKSGKQELRAQLKLAIVWNRVDIAYDCLKAWKEEKRPVVIDDMKELMMTLLKRGRVNFFELLSSHEVDVNNFLTIDVLTELYNSRIHKGRQLLANELKFPKGQALQKGHIGLIIKRVLGDEMEDRYRADSVVYQGRLNTFKYPFHELFLWAIINNMQDTALYFLNKGDESLAKSVIACNVLRKLSRIAGRQGFHELKKTIEKNILEFENMSISLLRTCFDKNEIGAEKLLKYELKYWGKETCLHLAVLANHEEFVAYTACQKMLTKIWEGELQLHNYPAARVVIGILCPFLIPWFQLKEEKNEQEDDNENEGFDKRSSRRSLANGKASASALEAQQRRRACAGAYSKCCSGLKRTLSKYYNFYTAPITKFWSNSLTYLLFLGLFTSVVTLHLQKQPSVREWLLLVFVSTLTLEEMRQIVQSDGRSLRRKIRVWMSRSWNICDAAGILFFFVGFILRMFDSTRSQGHVILSLDICIWIIRILDIFSMNKYFGPYIFMIGKMFIEMIYFLFIMVVFLLAYGILRTAVLVPRNTLEWDILADIFYKPYFQIYGELFLSERTANTTLFDTPRDTSYGDTIIAIALGVYLLVANILLLNLLIAIFNNIYSKTETRSQELWGFNRYYVIEEYKTKPTLVPPFIIINHIISLLRQCCCKEDSKPDGKFKERLSHTLELRELMAFEESCTTEHLLEYEKSKRDSSHKGRTDVLQKLDVSIKGLCRFLKPRSHSGQISRQRGKSMEELNDGKEDVHGPSKVTRHRGTTVRRSRHFFDRGLSLLRDRASTETSDEEDFVSKKVVQDLNAEKPTKAKENSGKKEVPKDEGRLPMHQLSRISPYPGTKIKRLDVADGLVNWKIPFANYTPVSFSIEPFSFNLEMTDPDLPSDPPIRFNQIDGTVDRRSNNGTYSVIDGYPRNPGGRTGLEGRGKFSRWGPNQRVDAVISRWRRGGTEGDTEQLKPILQFLVIQKEDRFFVPSGMVNMGEVVPSSFYRDLCELLLPQKAKLKIPNAELDKFLENGFQLYSGYVDDPHNTDNAWMETTVVNFHDEDGSFLKKLETKKGTPSECYIWKDSNTHHKASSQHVDCIRSVAELRNAEFYYPV